MKRLICVLIGLALFAAGCVRTRHYRYVQKQDECFAGLPGDPLPGASGEQRLWPSLDCRSTLYSVGYIEFGEDGAAIDAAQADKALRLIDEVRKRTPDGRIITVVYVHGWKNNASESSPGGKPKDVEKFQHALAELGARSREAAARAAVVGRPARPPIPIVGIYMAWRGKSLMGPSWFNFLSFWGRRNAANRAGEGADFAANLKRVIDKVNEPAGGVATGSRLLLVGHSFGARVLEHAIETRAIELHRPVAGSTAAAPIVDLALYVNSANDARLTVTRLEKLRAAPIEVRHPDYVEADCGKAEMARTPQCGRYPLLVAITSRGDTATKYLLPTANTVNLDKSVPIPPAPVGQFLDPTPNPSIFRRSAAAHMKFLQSHVIRDVPCPPAPPPLPEPPAADADARLKAMVEAAVAEALGKQDELAARREAQARIQKHLRKQAEAAHAAALDRMRHPVCDPGEPLCRFVFRTQGDNPTCFEADARGAKTGETGAVTGALDPYNTTAFWIMDVDQSVIKDHGDIWNLSFIEMLGQLMAPRGFFEPAGGRVQLRAAPTAPAASSLP